MARLVAWGHMTEAPTNITYLSVLSQETVRKALMIATLNHLEVELGDIWNVYTGTCYRKGVDYFGSRVW